MIILLQDCVQEVEMVGRTLDRANKLGARICGKTMGVVPEWPTSPPHGFRR